MVAAVVVPRGLTAQAVVGPRIEGRLETTLARHGIVQVGLGFNSAAGPYLRWGLAAAAGATRLGDRTTAAYRADAVLRFLLDPFRESRRGPYGIAGVSLVDDGSRDWEPRVFVGLGVEGRARGSAIPSVELALGGGVRIAAVLRRTRGSRR